MQRWQEGCTNAARLTQDSAIGLPRQATVRTSAAAHLGDQRPAANRSESEQADLTRILDRCTQPRTVDQLVSDFAGRLRQRQGQHSTPGRSRRARDTLSHSSGAVERQHHQKAIKRALYGRAKLDLPRHRVPLAVSQSHPADHKLCAEPEQPSIDKRAASPGSHRPGRSRWRAGSRCWSWSPYRPPSRRRSWTSPATPPSSPAPRTTPCPPWKATRDDHHRRRHRPLHPDPA